MKNEYTTLAIIAGLIAVGGVAISLLGADAVIGYLTVVAVLSLVGLDYGTTRKSLSK